MDIRVNMFRNMMCSDVSFFDTTRIGAILTLLSEDAENVQEAFGTTKRSQFTQLGQVLIGLITVWAYNWKLALLAMAYIPVCITVIAVMSYFIDAHVMRKFKYTAESMTIAEETLAAVRTVKAFNRERHEDGRFLRETQKAERQEHWIGGYACFMFWVVMVLNWVLMLGSMYWGGKMVQDGEMEAGNLFSIFGSELFGNFALIMLQTSLQAEQKAIASGGRILDYTEYRPAVNFSGGEEIEDFRGHIEFRNVSFKYPTRDVYVLRDVSFVIEPGQIGALVGHSGSGKSTCVQLLERFYDVTEGVILLDGRDIRELNPRWLHRRMALVSQEPILFQMSIRENIKYGKRKATEEDIQSAVVTANAARFITKFEKGLETVVGEKGSTLSGGQRQRIAIARAVIRNPVVLITDEATSALDAASEKKVQLALDKVMEGRTAVVVAHRLSTIRNAHVIYVFDTGEIKEQGTHDDLVQRKGWYYELVKRQLTAADIEALGPRGSVDRREETSLLPPEDAKGSASTASDKRPKPSSSSSSSSSSPEARKEPKGAKSSWKSSEAQPGTSRESSKEAEVSSKQSEAGGKTLSVSPKASEGSSKRATGSRPPSGAAGQRRGKSLSSSESSDKPDKESEVPDVVPSQGMVTKRSEVEAMVTGDDTGSTSSSSSSSSSGSLSDMADSS
jgi:ABC-type multidrug transport system fused ATPase/permease subunit